MCGILLSADEPLSIIEDDGDILDMNFTFEPILNNTQFQKDPAALLRPSDIYLATLLTGGKSMTAVRDTTQHILSPHPPAV